MKRTCIFFPALLLGSTVAVTSLLPNDVRPAEDAVDRSAASWEYRVIELDSIAAAGTKGVLLNDLGKQGWELTTATEGEGIVRVFFRRRTQ